jgi:hypothetical protein
MTNQTKLIRVLSVSLVITSAIAFWGLIGKGKSVAPVVMSMKPDTLRREHVFEFDRPWSNYPELAAQARRDYLSSVSLKELGVEVRDILSRDSIIFFRSHLGNNPGDTLLAAQLLPVIKGSPKKIKVLVDKRSRDFLKQIGLLEQYAPYTTLIVRDIPIKMEHYRFSYFFASTENNVRDFFFPKKGMMSGVSNYLEAVEI